MAATSKLARRKFDVVIVGAGGSGHTRVAAARARGAQRRGADQGVPDALAHRRRAGRHRGVAGQHVGRQLALPLLRHDQGFPTGSATRTRSSSCAARRQGRLRARAPGDAVRPQPDGTIYQRPFGGHTANYGEKPVQRRLRAADRTGHAMLHTLYQQNLKAHARFRRVDGARSDPRRRRRRAGRDRARDGTSEVHPRGQDDAARHRRRQAHLRRPRNAFINTGDGLGMAARAGLPLGHGVLQFHPTGVAGPACCSPRAAAARAILRNCDGERFVEATRRR